MMFRVPAGRAGEPDELVAALAVPGQRRVVLRHRRGASRRRRAADDLGAGCRPSAAETRSSRSSSGPRRPRAGAGAVDVLPLRDLRVRPARAPPLRRAGRRDGRVGLRRRSCAPTSEVVFGHEFSGEVAEYGPGCRKTSPTGTPVVALPLLRRGDAVHAIGLSVAPPAPTPSRWWSRSRSWSRSRTACRPSSRRSPSRWRSAGTRSVAARSRSATVAIVIGCGPVGLAVICDAQGAGGAQRSSRATSRPAGARWRRRAARTWWSTRRRTRPTRRPRTTATCDDARARSTSRSARWRSSRRLPVPVVARLARGRDARREAEEPGDLRVRRRARHHRRRSSPARRCSRASSSSASAWEPTGSGPRWRSTRRSTCGSCSATRRSSSATRSTCSPRARSTRGRSSPATVGLAGVESAFDALGDPETHAKILIDPKSDAAAPRTGTAAS